MRDRMSEIAEIMLDVEKAMHKDSLLVYGGIVMMN